MKKFISILLAISIVLTILIVLPLSSSAADLTEGDYRYTVSNNEATITDYTGQGGDITIPSTLGGYPVTSIGYGAFSGCKSLTSVTIPDNVTTIGYNAFYYCRSLTSVTIPNSVTSIGEYAFGGCTSLISVTIGNGVKSIESSIFAACTSLKSVTIGNGVTNIEVEAFFGCTSLTEINVSEDNKNYKSIDGNVYSKDGTELIQYAIGKKDAAFTIPDSVISIGSYAFYYCKNLTSVEIPDSVISIESFIFSECTSLKSVTIGNGVTGIGFEAFSDCTSLTEINVSEDNKNYKSIDGNVYSKDGTKLILYAIGKKDTSFTIPDSVTSIGYEAFCSCTSLKSVTIPNSVTSIGDYAFGGCDSLTSVNITDIAVWCNIDFGDTPLVNGASLYLNNELITDLDIPDTVKEIKPRAFEYCTSLTSVTIPDSVTTIGYDAFEFCPNLTSVTIGNSVTSIGEGAFRYCDSLTSVTIPGSVTSIGGATFVGCTSLKSVTIPDSVTSIGDYAFCDCDSLTSVTIGNGVKSIGHEAFRGCKSLTSVTIPDSVTSIGNSAFYGCQKLTDVYYGGTEDDRSKISIGYGNECLTKATWHYDTYKDKDLAAIDEAVGDDTSDNVLAAAKEAKANINAAKTKVASAEARDIGIAAINAAKQDNNDANFKITKGGASGIEGVPTVQAKKYDDGTARIHFIWQLKYDTDIPITSIGAYLFNWDSFFKGSKNAVVRKKNPEITSGDTFAADLVNITNYSEGIIGIPMVNGIVFTGSAITSTVNESSVN